MTSFNNHYDKFSTSHFKQKFPIDNDDTMHIFELNYYESGLSEVENLLEGDTMIGDIKLTRRFVPSDGD